MNQEAKESQRMKTLIFAGLLAINLMVWAPHASANLNCGIAPIPPIGCENPRCVCDSNGNCRWVFDC